MRGRVSYSQYYSVRAVCGVHAVNLVKLEDHKMGKSFDIGHLITVEYT